MDDGDDEKPVEDALHVPKDNQQKKVVENVVENPEEQEYEAEENTPKDQESPRENLQGDAPAPEKVSSNFYQLMSPDCENGIVAQTFVWIYQKVVSRNTVRRRKLNRKPGAAGV